MGWHKGERVQEQEGTQAGGTRVGGCKDTPLPQSRVRGQESAQM